MFHSFAAAIELYHRAQASGQNLYIFPPNTLPNEFEQLHQSLRHPFKKENELARPQATLYAKAS
ncbi:hypothetical protein ACN4EK_01960 [Pantanalinema rosaneae CENA516]|uniref:hypothetical protein n=1 Tax=Pantanalinema rosaneae TaxID=1620701 RepID=UPI003D6F2250